jgi:2'-5' RNA ligase
LLLTNHRFFIALLPDAVIQAYANSVKQQFAEKYASRAALRSPPHVTLQPPFLWERANLLLLTQCLENFAAQCSPVLLRLSGFGAFPPRVIYLQVERTPELVQLQQALTKTLADHLAIADSRTTNRPFIPHLTVGFRDLTRQNFHLSWAEFQCQKVELTCTVFELTLLLHTGQKWEVFQTFPFQTP